MRYTTTEQKVAAGARLMDKLLPNWYNAVDPEKPKMTSGINCLLGQTFGINVEKSLVKEMYPKEYAAVTTCTREITNGYNLASRYGGNMLGKIMDKLGLTSRRKGQYEALETVCRGNLDTRCLWIKEIA